MVDRVRERARKAAWSLLTLGMALAFLELLARRMDPDAEHTHIQMDFDADLMWGLRNEARKGTSYRVNSLGLRGDDPADAPGSTRVLTLGDSSIYGHGVDISEVFVARFAASAAALGHRVEPINGGVPGYSTFQSLRLLDRVAPRARPDLVVIGNLWSDAYLAAISDRAWAEQLAEAYGPWQPVVGPLAALADRSALARRLRRAVHDGVFPAKGKANEIGWSHLIEPEPDASGGPPAHKPDPASLTPRVPLSEYVTNLHALATKVREAGALPIYLILPHPLDATTGLRGHDLAYRDAMRAVALAEAAPLVDGPAWYRDHPVAGARFSDDIHPNAVGHAQLADALLATILANPAAAERLAEPR
jgi:lysophospholipase L1-like esterase